jgi:hypothetical protein
MGQRVGHMHAVLVLVATVTAARHADVSGPGMYRK